MLVAGAAITLPQLIAFAVAALFTLALFAWLRLTYLGKAMRATAQDPKAATLMGIDTGKMLLVAFLVGTTCVGVAGMLMAPLFSTYPTVGLQFVLVAFVVVVLGGLGSAVGALIGGADRRVPGRDGRLLCRHRLEGGAVLHRVHRGAAGSPGRTVRPARRRGPGKLECRARRCTARGEHVDSVCLFAAAILVPLLSDNLFLQDATILILLWAGLASAWNIAGGFAGQISLGHAAFFGLGAYTSTLLKLHLGLSPWLGMLCGGVLVVLVSGFIAFAATPLARPVLQPWSRWRSPRSSRSLPPAGTASPAATKASSIPFEPGLRELHLHRQARVDHHHRRATCSWSTRSACGSRARASGFSLPACARTKMRRKRIGIDTRRAQSCGDRVSAFLTALGGTFYAQYVGFLDPGYVLSFDLSIKFALMCIIGGLGTPLGPILGAVLITALEMYLRAKWGGARSGLYLIVYGVLLILIVRVMPEGLVRGIPKWLKRRRRPVLLELEGVSKRFGGLTAVSEVSFAVAEGEVVGSDRPQRCRQDHAVQRDRRSAAASAGHDHVSRGSDISGQRPYRICRLGLCRTFQIVKPFGNLSVLDNVVDRCIHARAATAAQPTRWRRRSSTATGLARWRDSLAHALPIGLRKRVEVGARTRDPAADDSSGRGHERPQSDRAARDDGPHPAAQLRRLDGPADRARDGRGDDICASASWSSTTEKRSRTRTPQEVARDPRVIEAYLGEEYLIK